MLNIEIRTDSVHIEGYVNAVERKSRKIKTKDGICYEVIKAGAFADALGRNSKVKLLHNHNMSKEVGTVTLNEDTIGLRAIADITDPDTIQLARDNKLNGWSFGFYANDKEIKKEGADAPTRYIKSLDLYEVSLIDDTQIPCYDGTSIEYRSENESGEVLITELECRSERDYSMDKEILIAKLKCADIELRYNPYHDPEDGKFCSANGTGKGGMTVVPKGGKAYTQQLNHGYTDEDIDDMYEAYVKQKSTKVNAGNSQGTSKELKSGTLSSNLEEKFKAVDEWEQIKESNSPITYTKDEWAEMQDKNFGAKNVNSYLDTLPKVQTNGVGDDFTESTVKKFENTPIYEIEMLAAYKSDRLSAKTDSEGEITGVSRAQDDVKSGLSVKSKKSRSVKIYGIVDSDDETVTIAYPVKAKFTERVKGNPNAPTDYKGKATGAQVPDSVSSLVDGVRTEKISKDALSKPISAYSSSSIESKKGYVWKGLPSDDSDAVERIVNLEREQLSSNKADRPWSDSYNIKSEDDLKRINSIYMDW